MTIGEFASRLWLRRSVRGLEHIPEEGPALIVGTRSGGRGNAEEQVLAAALAERSGSSHPLVTVSTAAEVGWALDDGRLVLVQPGGEHDAHRPSWEPPAIDRVAAAALVGPALDREVPVVPLAAIGAQETALFLTRGETLARSLRLDRTLGIDRLPVSLALPWGLNVGDRLGHVPLPTSVTLLLLPALAIADRFGEDPDPEAVAHLLAACIRSGFDALADERGAPVRVPGDLVRAGQVLAGSGLARPMRPDVVARAALGLIRDGVGPAGAYEYSAARFPHETAVIDDAGELTFAELAARVASLAASLSEAGVGAGDRFGVLCRNHAGFVEAIAAASRLGADVVLLNTSFAPPQLAGVVEREGITALAYDEDLAHLLAAVDNGTVPHRFVADSRADKPAHPSFEELTARAEGRRPAGRASGQGRYVLLTSGTTGTPRGAARPTPHTPEPLVAFLARIPLRQRDVMLIASPLFHAWGFGNLGFSMVLSSTVVLQSHFDAEATLAAIERHRVRVLVVVPVMLQRMVHLPAEVRARYDTSSLEVVASSGSVLAGELAVRFMDAFGDVLYNLYGSTEAAWAGIATPADLRSAPGTAGRPPRGTDVHLVDHDGADVAPGAVGRILVSSGMVAPGPPTTSSAGTVPPGMMATGDVGHVDELGRLFVDGREDDMIVSGGENVYPGEVEDVLAAHPSVADVAVIGVPDPDFGQRLKALVVRQPGARLSATEVRAYVRARLARFKVPRDVEFVDELPRNITGKILRRDLRSRG